MRRLTRHRQRPGREERGFSALVVALMTPALIAAVGMSVDVGNLSLQKNKLVKATDSAAATVGQDCAAASRSGATATVVARCSAVSGRSTAQLMLNNNIDNSSVAPLAGLTPTNNSVTIRGTKNVPMNFAAAIGVGPKSITAETTARWDQVPESGATFLPLAISLCDYYRDSPAQFANPDTANRGLYRYDLYQTALGPIASLPTLAADTCNVPGGGTLTMKKGALWLPGLFETLPNILGLIKQDGQCSFSTNTLNTINGTVTAAALLFPSDCMAKAMTLEKGKTYLFPIYKTGQLLNLNVPLTVSIVGYAKFKVTGWRVGALLSGSVESQDSGSHSAPECKAYLVLGLINQCYGIQGQFVTSVKREPGIKYVTKSATTLDLGVITVKITE